MKTMDRREFNKTMGVVGAGVVSGFGPNPSNLQRGSRAASPRRGQELDVTRARRETPGCTLVTHFRVANGYR